MPLMISFSFGVYEECGFLRRLDWIGLDIPLMICYFSVYEESQFGFSGLRRLGRVAFELDIPLMIGCLNVYEKYDFGSERNGSFFSFEYL